MKSFDCELYMDLMPLVKDGAASDSSRKALEQHMAQCENCRSLFGQLPQDELPEENASKTLKKIHRSLNVTGWVLILAASIIGALLTLSDGMGFNLILFPLAGIIAYCTVGQQVWRSGAHIAVFSLLFLLVRLAFLEDGLFFSEFASCALFALFYAAAYLVGVGAAWLVHYTFTRPVSSGWKARTKKILAGAMALLVAGSVFWACDAFLGNPISYTAAKNHSQSYVQEKYPELELTVGDPYFDWYSGGHYEIAVTCPDSQDIHFYLHYDRLGRLSWDGYEDQVLGGQNTFSRIDGEYTQLMLPVQEELSEKLSVSVSSTLSSDWPSIYDDYDYPFYPENRIILSQLTPDGEYNTQELAAKYGNINLWGQVSAVSEEEICRMLLTLKETLDAKGITIATVDVDIYDYDNNTIRIASFPYDEIGSEGFQEKVHEARIAWDAFQVRYDAAIAAQNP